MLRGSPRSKESQHLALAPSKSQCSWEEDREANKEKTPESQGGPANCQQRMQKN